MMPPWWVLGAAGLAVYLGASVGIPYAVALGVTVVLAYVVGWLDGRSHERDRQVEDERRLAEDLTDTALKVFGRWNQPTGGTDADS